MSIIDTIDNAVRGWATSDDAMRWTPDPPPVSLDIRIRIPAAYTASGTPLWSNLGLRVIRLFGLGESFKALSIARRTPTRPARVSAMRRAYRVKRGGRW